MMKFDCKNKLNIIKAEIKWLNYKENKLSIFDLLNKLLKNTNKNKYINNSIIKIIENK